MATLPVHAKALRSENQPPKLRLIESSFTLTKQEKRVVLLILEGWSLYKISQFLFLSERTVESYISNICRRLKVRNRIEIIRYVLANPRLIDDCKSEPHKVNQEICVLKEQKLKAAWQLSSLRQEIDDQSIKQKLEKILQILQPEQNHLKVFWGDRYN